METLHRVSAFFFYLLAGTFFLAYLFMRNEIGALWPVWWMKVADLPLLLVALLTAGLSFGRSMKRAEGFSLFLTLGIALPLIVLFLFFAMLNFWMS